MLKVKKSNFYNEKDTADLKNQQKESLILDNLTKFHKI